MPDHLFEYAIIRIVPKVERQEFINIGVLLLCQQELFLDTRIEIDQSRLMSFCPHLELDEIEAFTHAFQQICRGAAAQSAISNLAIAERFRWLTAPRSTVLQTSSVHPGLCTNGPEMLDRLFVNLVGCHQ